MNSKILLLLITSVSFCFTRSFSQQTNLFPGNNVTYNEQNTSAGTVAIDITIQNQNTPINSLSLHFFDVGSTNTATIGVRIYSMTLQYTNASVVFAQTTTTTNIHNASVTLPVSFTLQTGVIYRIGFYMASTNSNHFFKSFQTTALDYYDDNYGFIKIIHNEGFYGQPDAFPTSGLYPMPYMSLGINTTSVKENTLLNSINSLSPNPANEFVYVSLKKTEPEIKLELIDLSGTLLSTQNFYNTSEPSINILNFDKGFYFVRVSTKDESATLKFIKN